MFDIHINRAVSDQLSAALLLSVYLILPFCQLSLLFPAARDRIDDEAVGGAVLVTRLVES